MNVDLSSNKDCKNKKPGVSVLEMSMPQYTGNTQNVFLINSSTFSEQNQMLCLMFSTLFERKTITANRLTCSTKWKGWMLCLNLNFSEFVQRALQITKVGGVLFYS